MDPVQVSVTAAAEHTLTPQVKALTLQLPNERELKNEARWIYCWNLWTELIRQQLELTVSNGEIDLRQLLPSQAGRNDSKEALLTELQSHIVTKPVQTLSKVKTIRLIKEIHVKIQVWEKLCNEAVNFLSTVQILSCESNTGDRDLSSENMKMLGLLKDKLMEKIAVASKNIDYHYGKLEEAIGRFKKFKCHGLFADPVVAKAIEKFNKRGNKLDLPGGISLPQNQNELEYLSQGSTTTPNILVESSEILDQLLGTDRKKEMAASLAHPPDFLPTKESIIYFMKFVTQGTEWYLDWSQFTESVLKEIESLAPALGSEVVTIMTKHINQQISLLKTLAAQVHGLTDKTIMNKKNTETDTSSNSGTEMNVMMTCLSIFDDFISLMESLKHEASYLLRYVEIALINLGVLDLGKEPRKLKQLRLYFTRNIISMKDEYLLSTVDYLYKQMGYLIEYIEFRFHTETGYLEKFGPMTADLLKKYTVNRRDVIQEREIESLNNVDELDLAMELRSMDLNNTQAPLDHHQHQFPLSRYHRAEDVRKWVEEAQRIKEMRDGLEANGSNATVGSSMMKNVDHWEDVADLKRTQNKARRFWKSSPPHDETEKDGKSNDRLRRFSLKRKN